MRKSMYATLAAAALLSTFVGGAEALTVPPVARDDSTIVTPVRDGCGPYRHFSPRYRRCIRN